MPGEHSRGPILSWKSDSMSAEIKWACESIHEERGKRIVEQERAYRPGAKLDSTNWKARRWRIKSCFNNTLQEDGLEDTPVLFPDRLNALVRSFDLEETGTLTLPTVGRKRCKLTFYSRNDEVDGSDEANCEFLFVEDSEDIIDLDSLEEPQVNATIVRLAQQSVFSMERLGSLNDGTVDLTTWASQMESLLLAPGRALEDIKTQGRRNRRAIERVQRAERTLGKQVDGLFNGQESHEAQQELRRLSDLQARAIAEKNADRPDTRLHKVNAHCTLFDVASDLRQDLQALFELNRGVVEDVLDLTPGQPVVVFR